MIETVAEHSFQTLQPGSKILDVGCLGFLFADEMKRRGHFVQCVDIQKLDGDYDRLAIAGHDGYGYIVPSTDRQAYKIQYDNRAGIFEEIKCETLQTYTRKCGISFWDLVKIDVEGSEREIIYSLDRPVARQMSIEFHLHTGVYKKSNVDDMVEYLELIGYKTAKHEYTAAHGCGYNFWDSLFVL